MAFSHSTSGYGYTIRFAAKSRSCEQATPATVDSRRQTTSGGRRKGRSEGDAAVVAPRERGTTADRGPN